MICGTDPYPQNFRAKKWKIKDKYFTKEDFQFMMRNLPVPVNEEDIDQMFEYADKDKDGKINYRFHDTILFFNIFLTNWFFISSLPDVFSISFSYFSEFETMINPQVKPTDGKKSLKSIKKFLPQLSSIAKKEGLSSRKTNQEDPSRLTL